MDSLRVLVTGAKGLQGTSVLRALEGKGHELFGLTRDNERKLKRYAAAIFVTAVAAAALIGCTPREEKAVQAAIEGLTYDSFTFASGDDKDSVSSRFTVPDSAENDVTITWESSNADLVSVVDGNASVTRPGFFEGDAPVTLNATAASGEVSQDTMFALTVLAEKDAKEYTITGAGESYEYAVGALTGTSVAMSGAYAIVGAPRDEGPNPPKAPAQSPGAAYVFKREGVKWSLVQILRAPNFHEWGGFGFSVAISGDNAVISASGRDAVYVFERNGTQWNSVARLLDSDKPEDYFGSNSNSVAIDGNQIAVGRRNTVYFYERTGSNWIETAAFRNPTANEYNTAFARSVAISGDYAVAGDPADDGESDSTYYDAGAAYFYKRTESGWQELEVLRIADGEKDDSFGTSVAIDGRYAAVSSRGGRGPGGAVYVYEITESGLHEVAELRTESANSYHFGASLAIENGLLVVGQPHYGAGGDFFNDGAVYVYRMIGAEWREEKIMSFSGQYGMDVAISDGNVIVGAPWASAEKIEADPYLSTSLDTDLTGATFFYW